MTLENVADKLALMGIDADKYFKDDKTLFDSMCEMEYNNMTARMRSYINYSPDEYIPQDLEHVVDDWTVARIINIIRIRDPSTYPPKGMEDPVKKLEAVPQTEIVRYRRLV